MCRCESHSSHTRGVIMYTNKNMEIFEEGVVRNRVWRTINLKVKIEGKNCNTGGMYRSPASSEKKFIEWFEGWIGKKIETVGREIIMGDFNIRWDKQDLLKSQKKQIYDRPSF